MNADQIKRRLQLLNYKIAQAAMLIASEGETLAMYFSDFKSAPPAGMIYTREQAAAAEAAASIYSAAQQFVDAFGAAADDMQKKAALAAIARERAGRG